MFELIVHKEIDTILISSGIIIPKKLQMKLVSTYNQIVSSNDQKMKSNLPQHPTVIGLIILLSYDILSQ